LAAAQNGYLRVALEANLNLTEMVLAEVGTI